MHQQITKGLRPRSALVAHPWLPRPRCSARARRGRRGCTWLSGGRRTAARCSLAWWEGGQRSAGWCLPRPRLPGPSAGARIPVRCCHGRGIRAGIRVARAASVAHSPGRCGSPGHCRGGVEERVDGRVDLGGDHLRGGDVEFAVEVQERKAVDKGPHRGRQGVRVHVGEGGADDAADLLRDGCGRGDPFCGRLLGVAPATSPCALRTRCAWRKAQARSLRGRNRAADALAHSRVRPSSR